MLIVFSFIAGFLFYLDIRDGLFSMKNTTVRLIEIFTCAIPPSLFFSFWLTSVIIGSWLKDKEILIFNESKLTECGRIKCICFDKTGTLTSNSV